MITINLKKRVLEAIAANRHNFNSDARQARALGINSAQLSRIKKGAFENVISEANWISIARKLSVTLNQEAPWATAKTPVFNKVYGQLQKCQYGAISAIFCDKAGIGKTYAALAYSKANKYVVYIDCSQVKTKQKLVRQIAKEFGVGYQGRYQEVYEDLVFYLRTIPTPLIILDEAGDLNYDAFFGMQRPVERYRKMLRLVHDGCRWAETKNRKQPQSEKSGLCRDF